MSSARANRSRNHRPKPRRRRRRFLAGSAIAAALVVGFAGVWWWQRTRTVQIPDSLRFHWEQMDPAVATLLRQRLTEVEGNTRSGEAWGKLGMALLPYEYQAEAMVCLAMASQLDPKDPRWPYHRANLLAAKDPTQALELVRQASKLADLGRAPQADAKQAQWLLELGRLEEAEAVFRGLIGRDAGRAPAWLGLARIALLRDRPAEATNLLWRCLENPHTIQQAHGLMSLALRRLDDERSAVLFSSRAQAMPPDPAWPDPFQKEVDGNWVGRKALIDKAERLSAHQDGELLRMTLEELTRRYPDEPAGWVLLGRWLLDQGRCAEAEQAALRHAKLEPDSVNGQFLLGLCLLCQERYEEAAAYLVRTVGLKPDFGEAYFNLGFAQARAGHGLEAMASFRESIRLSPEFIDAYLTLADLLNQTGRSGEALELMRRAEELSPGDSRIQAVRERIEAK